VTVCDLVLGPAGDETNVAACLEEVVGRLRMPQGGKVAPGDLTTRARGLVLREPDGVPPLAVELSSSSLSRPSEEQVSAAALNGVRRGGLAGADHHPVALPRAGGQVGPAGVWL
jgi:hypothetical protein